MRVAVSLLAASLALAASAHAAPAALDCTNASLTLEVAGSGDTELAIDAQRPAWLEIAESGHELEVVSHQLSKTLAPLRFARWSGRIESRERIVLRRLLTTRDRATARVTLDCDHPGRDAERLRWAAESGAIGAALDKPVAATELPALLARIDALTAIEPRSRAVAAHLRAQALYVNGRAQDAVDAFAVAEREWLAVGDANAAIVARTGRVEDLQKIGRYDEALALADPRQRPKGTRYFEVRLANSRCLALRYLGRASEADRCFRATLPQFERLDERLDWISGLQDHADVLRYLGRSDAAERAAAHALGLATLPRMETHRGRILLTLADIALDRGAPTVALSRFDAALVEFARAKSSRWEANAYLRVANLYVQLGAYDEARGMALDALSRLDARDAPARVAAAQVALGRIEAAAQRHAEAVDWLDRARATYEKLAMPAELDSTRLALVRTMLSADDLAAADALASVRDATQRLNATDWAVVTALLDARAGRCNDSGAGLFALHFDHLGLPQQVEAGEAAARCLAARDGPDAAERFLLARADALAGVARAVRNPLLRRMLLRQIEPLRRFAVALLLEHDASTRVEQLWRWQAITTEGASSGDARSAESIARFDRLVAAQLLRTATPGAEAAASRELLSIFANDAPARSRRGVAALELDDVRKRLASDEVLLVVLDGGAHAALLEIRADGARAIATAAWPGLRADAEALATLLRSPQSAADAIDRGAERLSRAVLGGLEDSAQPAVVLVHAGSRWDALPWALLRWPGHSGPMLEASVVSVVRTDGEPTRARANRPALRVFLASRDNSGALPELGGVAVEPALIRDALHDEGAVTVEPRADRRAVLDALRREGSWVHVATHGAARPARIGYSGLWLNPALPGADPEFLSALDVVEGARGALVVINACDAAAPSPREPEIGSSFAEALARAGARDVVAARWAVSDTASALWVPTFYGALRNDSRPRAVAHALAAAQRRLRDSRAFRHPFYWASYVHFGRI